nr:GNAT family N-acetyltransferase [Chloroflexota bacterium]
MHPISEAWQTFGRHLVRYRDPGLTVAFDLGPGRFAVLTGLPDIELNVTGLHPPAAAAEANALVDRIDEVGAPTLVFVSRNAALAVLAVLAARGFAPTVLPEPLMWRACQILRPTPASPTFSVRRVAGERDLGALVAVLAAAITMPPEVTRRQFALDRLAGDGLGSWLAWDGVEPVSTVTLTWDDEACAVWEMMTVPAHRRRGAGRVVLE